MGIGEPFKKLWEWGKNFRMIGDSLNKLIEGQARIEKKLDEVFSPEKQLAEMNLLRERLKVRIEKNEEVSNGLKAEKTVNADDMEKHKQKIEGLEKENVRLVESQKDLVKVIEKVTLVIKDKDEKNNELSKELERLKKKLPSPLTDIYGEALGAEYWLTDEKDKTLAEILAEDKE